MFDIVKTNEAQNYICYAISGDGCQIPLLICKGTYNIREQPFDKKFYINGTCSGQEISEMLVMHGVAHIRVDDYGCITVSCGDLSQAYESAGEDEVRSIFESMLPPILELMLPVVKNQKVPFKDSCKMHL